MHMAASVEVLRKDLRIAEEHLASAFAERDELRAALNAAKAEAAKMARERDAAIADMKRMLDNCKACVHQDAAPEDCDCECMRCEKPCACNDCRDGSRFEWQGMKEETK